MINRHFHWQFSAYDLSQMIEPDKINWITNIEVIGYQNETAAREAAEEIITRDIFKLVSVRECNTCKFQQETTDALNKLMK